MRDMPDLRDRFREGLPFAEYLGSVRKNRELWRAVYERAEISEATLERARGLEGRWHLLALSEDWCGDAVNILPVVARLAEEVPTLELRVLSRDENPDLMDRHLTGGRSRSIPVVMVLDEEYREQGWWGPRPEELQAWVVDEGSKLDARPRYRETRRWYAQDKGRTTLAEILDLAEEAAAAP